MVHELLSRLNKVRQIGKDKWKACCPSHHDRNPSLDIALGDDGRILWHCKAGCGQHEVKSAFGLPSLGSFPKHKRYSKPNKNAFPTTDVLRRVQREAFIVLIAALTSKTQTEEDLDRLKTAASLIKARCGMFPKIKKELIIVSKAALNIANGWRLTKGDLDHLKKAASSIGARYE